MDKDRTSWNLPITPSLDNLYANKMDDFTNPGIKQVVPKVETHNLQIRSPLYDGMEADSHTSFAFTFFCIYLAHNPSRIFLSQIMDDKEKFPHSCPKIESYLWKSCWSFKEIKSRELLDNTLVSMGNDHLLWDAFNDKKPLWTAILASLQNQRSFLYGQLPPSFGGQKKESPSSPSQRKSLFDFSKSTGPVLWVG